MKITAKAPTTYQYRSLQAFGMPINGHGDGSYSSAMEFDSLEEARKYLRGRADLYFETEKELDDAYEDIQCGYLRLDAVIAHIED